MEVALLLYLQPNISRTRLVSGTERIMMMLDDLELLDDCKWTRHAGGSQLPVGVGLAEDISSFVIQLARPTKNWPTDGLTSAI